jgi:hypothetical protein
MLLWYAVYKDEPQDAVHSEERAPPAAVLRRFDDAVQLGMHDGRAVIGMWLIDDATERHDVVRIYGAVPPAIGRRHAAYLARNPG